MALPTTNASTNANAFEASSAPGDPHHGTGARAKAVSSQRDSGAAKAAALSMAPASDPHEYLDRFPRVWIDEAEIQRRAIASTVVCFETGDPHRARQFLRVKRQEPELFVYDRWRGLRLEGTRAPSAREQTGPLGSQIADPRNLETALRQVDARLQQTPFGQNAPDLVVTDLSELRTDSGFVADWALLDALRAWVREDRAYTADFTVYLFTPTAAIFDERTRSQFIVIPVEVSLPEERRVVVEHVASAFHLRVEFETVVRLTGGLDIRQLYSALAESAAKTNSFDPAQLKEIKARLIRTSGLLELEDPAHGFELVGGYDQIKWFLMHNVVELLTPEGAAEASRLGLPLPRGLLLFGPQGTGKSLIAKALAREVDLPFINFRTENIYSQYLGVSGQRFAQASKLIDALSPAIVFIDEIDRFGRRSGGTGDSAGEETRRVFSQMLEWLADPRRQSIVIGTTNRPDDLDPAFLRAGRFDYKIPMGFPGPQARGQILAVHLGRGEGEGIPRVPVEHMNDKQLLAFLESEIVPETELFKGSELEQVVMRCKRRARLERRGITAEDFRYVLKTFELDRDALERTRREFEEDVRRFADDASLRES